MLSNKKSKVRRVPTVSWHFVNTTTTPLIKDRDTASILFFQNHFHLKIREFEFYTIYKRMLLYTRSLQKKITVFHQGIMASKDKF
jgi:hypothetical protein